MFGFQKASLNSKNQFVGHTDTDETLYRNRIPILEDGYCLIGRDNLVRKLHCRLPILAKGRRGPSRRGMRLLMGEQPLGNLFTQEALSFATHEHAHMASRECNLGVILCAEPLAG